MAKTNRANLMAKLNSLKNEFATLEQKEFNYKVSRAWPGIGDISSISSAPELVRAWTHIHNSSKSEKEAIAALGMNIKEFEDVLGTNDTKHYGFTMEDWEHDLRMKRDELANSIRMNKIDEAIDILTENMSEDDKFNADMDMVDELLGD